MIFSDTSIVVEFLRTANPKLGKIIATEPAAVCRVVRAEVLYAARDATHRLKLLTALNMFAQFPTPEPMWDMIGDHAAVLRGAG